MPFIVMDTFKEEANGKSKSVNLPMFCIIYDKYGKKPAEFPISATHGFQRKFQSK